MYTDQSKSSRYSQTCLSSNLKLGAFSKANQEQEFARPAITIWFPRLENFENEMAAMLEHEKMTLKDLLLFTITVTVYTRQSQESLSPKKKRTKWTQKAYCRNSNIETTRLKSHTSSRWLHKHNKVQLS